MATQAICNVCGRSMLETKAEQQVGMCRGCAASYGFGYTPRAPSRRPPLPCGRCASTVLVRVAVRQKDGDTLLAPLALTFRRHMDQHLTGPPTEGRPDREAPVGLLDAWVCRECGAVEWWVGDPKEIPIGREYGTELVDVGGETPYR